jgi:hypothetical protein
MEGSQGKQSNWCEQVVNKIRMSLNRRALFPSPLVLIYSQLPLPLANFGHHIAVAPHIGHPDIALNR